LQFITVKKKRNVDRSSILFHLMGSNSTYSALLSAAKQGVFENTL